MTDAPLHHIETHPVDRNGAPMPVPNDGPSMHDLVAADLEARKALGLARYGSLLQAHNGRDALQDLYEELMDALVYLKQLMVERERYKNEMLTRERMLTSYRTTTGQTDLDKLYDRLTAHLKTQHGATFDDILNAPRTEVIQRHLNAHTYGRDVTHEYQPWGDEL